MITLRQVMNFVDGLGIVWNSGERVQAFTHPLWFFVLSLAHLVSGELFLTTLTVSAACAMVCFVLVARSAKSWLALLPPFGLLFSQAFIDYSSSGLETPFSYALLALACERSLRGAPFGAWSFVLLAAIFLTRMDHALLVLPLALVAWKDVRFSIWPLVPAVVLVIGWLAFSTFYFGHPLPNTFLAKLATGNPLSEYLERFWTYAHSTLVRDPITWLLIVSGLGATAFKPHRTAPIALGVVSYVVYLMLIGGDFMQGRMFAVPALMCVMISIHVLNAHGPQLMRLAVASAVTGVVLVALIGSRPMLSWRDDHSRAIIDGIADERRWYFQRYGLIAPDRAWPQPGPAVAELSRATRTKCGEIGALALAHNEIYWIDTCGLGSPYLARLPALEADDWRIGHNTRHVPAGFENWVLERAALIRDANLQALLEDAMLVSRRPLWTVERLSAIYRLNMHDYDYDRAALVRPGAAR